jgi:hypothetical protein
MKLQVVPVLGTLQNKRGWTGPEDELVSALRSQQAVRVHERPPTATAY